MRKRNTSTYQKLLRRRMFKLFKSSCLMSAILQHVVNNECIYRTRESVLSFGAIYRVSHVVPSVYSTTIETSLSCPLNTLFSPVLSLSVAINWQTLSLIANSLCALYCARKRIPGLKAFRGPFSSDEALSTIIAGGKANASNAVIIARK